MTEICSRSKPRATPDVTATLCGIAVGLMLLSGLLTKLVYACEDIFAQLIVDPPAVLRWRRNGRHRRATLGELLKGTRPFVVFPDDFLEGVVAGMSRANVAHISVVAHPGGPLVGYIGCKDLTNMRTRARAEEHDRATFYRFRPRPALDASA
jgi:hypothetical protein